MWVVSEKDGGAWEADSLKEIIKDIAISITSKEEETGWGFLPDIIEIYYSYDSVDRSERYMPSKIVEAFISRMQDMYEAERECSAEESAYRREVQDYFNSTRL